MPELRQLRAFVAVAEELNFTRAAERLHLAQQAISKSVRQLERELGVALLERTTREVRLTPAGVELLESGRVILVDADNAFRRAREVGLGVAGAIRVGVTPAVGPPTLEQVTRVLRADAPEISVALHELRPGEIAPLLRKRAVDFVLARTAPHAPDIESVALRPSPVVLLVHAEHRLAHRPTLRLAELDGERLLTWGARGTPFTDLLLARIAAGGGAGRAHPRRVTGGTDMPELRETAAVALVPAGWPRLNGTVELTIEDEMSLPLLVLDLAGAKSQGVRRVTVQVVSGWASGAWLSAGEW